MKVDMSTPFREEVLSEQSKVETPPPSMYKVLLLNDDFTPMEFVIQILQLFFHKNREQATRIMLQVHTQGHGVCGVYTKDVAATKVQQVLQHAKAHEHPLQCVMEEN